MSAVDQLKKELALNKALLCQVDAEIEQIQAHKDANYLPDDALESNQMPFFYGVVGEDGDPGILMPDGLAAGIYRGRIPIQNDGPFMCTDIMMVAQTEEFQGGLGPVWIPLSNNGSVNNVNLRAIGEFGVRFVVEGAGRALFQVNSNNETTRAAAFTPVSAFNYGVTLDGSNKGPNFTFKLPEVEVLAKNDVVRAEIEFGGVTRNMADLATRSARVFITFLGYKILEG